MKPILPNPKKKPELTPFQVSPCEKLTNFFTSPSKYGTLMQGGTGSGKTYVFLQALKNAIDAGHYQGNDNRPMQHYPVLLLCPKGCVVQHERKVREFGISKYVLVTSFDSLRSADGEMFIDWKTVVRLGSEDIVPEWIEDFAPDLIICDESQYLKNMSSQRGKVVKDYILRRLGKIAFVSATPFQKACEAEYAALGCSLTSAKDFTNWTWEVSPSGPTANSPTAIKRIRQQLEEMDSFIQITGVRYPFKPRFSLERSLISGKKEEIYNMAYERYCEIRRQLGKNELSGLLAIWNAMREFQMTAELLHADDAALMIKKVLETENRSVVYGANFVRTLQATKHLLIKAGISPGIIGELHGDITGNKKQENIDRFQFGDARIFLTTIKSGGTGLNLNHQYECSFPRTFIQGLPWSVYEMLQFLGRGQRIDNLSHVEQKILVFSNTIEEKVAGRLEDKISCVHELMDKSENFILKIFNQGVDSENDAIDAELEKKLQGELSEEDGDDTSGFDPAMLDGEK